MKKRTIIYLTHWRFPSEKTMTPLILKTCQQFMRDGYDTELWIPARRNRDFENVDPFEKHRIEKRFPVRRLPVLDLMHVLGNVGFLLMVATFNVIAFLRLLPYWRRGDVVVYAHDIRDVILPSMLGFPVFIEIHDFYESSIRMLNSFVLKRTSGLIVTNTIKMKRLADFYGFPRERMIKQPNAVEVSMFDIPLTKNDARATLGLPRDEKIVLYTGHLFGWKGVHTLAEASAFLPDGARIYFVGGTEHDREALKRFIAERTLTQITFFPHQEHAKIPIFMKAADVLVLPNTGKDAASKYETSPVKLFEYLASGQPIVVSDLPSIREVVSEREVFFAEADNPKSFGDVIAKALYDDSVVLEKKRAAQDLARMYTWEARGANIKKLIERSLA